jgi:large subunit ribosomal protein L31
MKMGVHPEYHKVLFIDTSTGDEWTSFSTLGAAEKREIEGQELPVIRLEISAHSHPFWTGHAREVDAEGRIDRFRRRYAGRGTKKAAEADPAAGKT